MAETKKRRENLELLYTIFCEDVRLEVGNKLSLMGVFQNIMVEQLPVTLFKFAVVNHWKGEGRHLSEVRILTPDGKTPVVVSKPTPFEIVSSGYADNISFFVNVTFGAPGLYLVQTLINSTLFDEQTMMVADSRSAAGPENVSESVN
ncbi:MAG TPA: hypothetical protein VF507_01240 [Pyrinomonadaceae bacterium]